MTRRGLCAGLAVVAMAAAVAMVSWLDSRGTYELRPTPDPAHPDRVLIPEDIAAAMVELDHMLPNAERERIRHTKIEAMSAMHMSLGTWLRNNWRLWGGSRLSRYFNALGLFHPDDMSGVILDSYWRHVRGLPLDVDKQVAWFREYWRQKEPPPPAICPRSGRDTKVSSWLHDWRAQQTIRIWHVADCGHGEYFVYDHGVGWYEPDEALLRRIPDAR